MGMVFAEGSFDKYGPRGGSLASPRSRVQPLWFQDARQPPRVLLVDPYGSFSRSRDAHLMGGGPECQIGELNQGYNRVCGILC